MKKEGTIAMFRYWDMLRAGRPSPFRTQIDPTAIKGRLPDTFILEFDDSNELRFRLAGTNICAVFGRELRHLPFAQIWREEDQEAVGALARATLLQEAVVLAEARGTSRQGRRATFEVLLLPLDAGPGQPRAIGLATPVDRPFWMGAHAIENLQLDEARLIDTDAPPALDIGAQAPSLAPEDLEPADRERTRRVRHLVVLDGGRS
ncbi:PAS domain-containing protein [Aliihoeflea sp. 40Bstr573]|uniref:PAS domain-containing protein n=1 Tax=Aliihoeflea sp. 40Bstr573 TaxID=2696467 RepID=UPI0020956ABB|nr:PAS domain-containing protein [Aliihoeflea sp. 40Bstr573]MCO6385959.1 PAS domain-containing protein [Aliihoeflea sp. 40Bstr573]